MNGAPEVWVGLMHGPPAITEEVYITWEKDVPDDGGVADGL
jgi:hypothetical protein